MKAIASYSERNQKRQLSLLEPLFGYADKNGGPHRPTFKEVMTEWLDATNFIKGERRSLAALNFYFHLVTFVLAVAYFCFFVSLTSLCFMVISVFGLATIYNTVWFHRYCSHRAFNLKKRSYVLLFLWTNPFVFREESYAIPHQIHHQWPEHAGDPYGPHLGWLGSYLAIESSQKLNTDISEEDYESLKRNVDHIGFKMNTYEQFRRTGAVENVFYYLARAVFAQLFWIVIAFGLGGWDFVMAWYTALFIMTFLIRDFNWRGHGGNYRYTKKPGWEFDERSRALNQHFYGYLAAEWHDNHHQYPMSAKCGFLPGQVDLAFEFIKFLSRIGIVNSYIDAEPRFRKAFKEKK